MMVVGESLFPADEPFSTQPAGPMALLPIFCVARFSRTDLSMIGARVLEIGRIADRRYASYL